MSVFLIGVGAQSTLGEHKIVAQKYVLQISKVPEFYMTFAREMPEFYIIMAEKYFPEF